MEKIDKVIQFFIDNRNDSRINIYKKIKYGHKHYYIIFTVDDDPSISSSQRSYFQIRENMEIVFDNRNECIEIFGGDEPNSIIIEDKYLLKKWSDTIENIVSSNIENRVIDIFEKTLNDCYNKNLYRDIQMKKILKEDESL